MLEPIQSALGLRPMNLVETLEPETRPPNALCIVPRSFSLRERTAFDAFVKRYTTRTVPRSKKAFQRRSIFSGEAKPLPYLLAHGPNVEQCHRGTTKTSHSTASVGRNCKSDIAMTAPGSTHTYDWAFPDFVSLKRRVAVSAQEESGRDSGSDFCPQAISNVAIDQERHRASHRDRKPDVGKEHLHA